jgi:hypothetical protein
LLSAARERGSLLVESQLTTFAGVFVWLAADNPAEARSALARVSSFWANVEYQVYHYTLVTAISQIEMYEGNGAKAFDLLMTDWPKIDAAMLLLVEIVWIYMHHLRGRAALLAAEQAVDPEPYLRWVRKDVRALRRSRVPMAQGSARQLQAALDFWSGNREAAIQGLQAAADAFAVDGQFFYQHACLSCRAQLLGPQGSDALKMEREWMASQGIRNPAAMARVHTPGFRLA